jgi:hypothetical protein
MERLARLRQFFCALWRRLAHPHIHTATPPQESPWCAECDALLTQAIAEDERRREEQ